MTGEAAFEASFGVSYFDYFKDHPEQGEVFDDFMRHSPDERHAAVAAAYDFSGAGVVVDIGGGKSDCSAQSSMPIPAYAEFLRIRPPS